MSGNQGPEGRGPTGQGWNRRDTLKLLGVLGSSAVAGTLLAGLLKGFRVIAEAGSNTSVPVLSSDKQTIVLPNKQEVRLTGAAAEIISPFFLGLDYQDILALLGSSGNGDRFICPGKVDRNTVVNTIQTGDGGDALVISKSPTTILNHPSLNPLYAIQKKTSGVFFCIQRNDGQIGTRIRIVNPDSYVNNTAVGLGAELARGFESFDAGDGLGLREIVMMRLLPNGTYARVSDERLMIHDMSDGADRWVVLRSNASSAQPNKVFFPAAPSTK